MDGVEISVYDFGLMTLKWLRRANNRAIAAIVPARFKTRYFPVLVFCLSFNPLFAPGMIGPLVLLFDPVERVVRGGGFCLRPDTRSVV